MPNKIWHIIWRYHYKNMRLLAAKKKQNINEELNNKRPHYWTKYPFDMYDFNDRCGYNLHMIKTRQNISRYYIQFDGGFNYNYAMPTRSTDNLRYLDVTCQKIHEKYLKIIKN